MTYIAQKMLRAPLKSIERRLVTFAAGRIASWYLHSPDLRHRILHYLPDLKSLAVVAANEAAFALEADRIFGYYSADFELTNICNLSCKVCPTNGPLDRREKGHMELGLYKQALRDNPGIRRIRLNLWGEPLLHPQLLEFIAEGKRLGKYVCFHTNGTLLSRELAEELVLSGLDAIIFSMDGVEEVYEDIRGHSYADTRSKILSMVDARQRLSGNTMIGILAVGTEDVVDITSRIRAEWERVVDTLEIISFTRYDPDLPIMRKGPCRELWRGHLPITWDGRVVACCPDFAAAMEIGRLPGDSLEELINGPRLRAARRAHLQGSFGGPCRTCHEDAGSPWVSSRYDK